MLLPCVPREAVAFQATEWSHQMTAASAQAECRPARVRRTDAGQWIVVDPHTPGAERHDDRGEVTPAGTGGEDQVESQLPACLGGSGAPGDGPRDHTLTIDNRFCR